MPYRRRGVAFELRVRLDDGERALLVVADQPACGVGVTDFGHAGISREGRAADPDAAPAELLARTTSAAGRAVLVSGLAVGAALAALYAFADPLRSAMAPGGGLVVGTATLAALTLVPALIAVAHRRIPAPGSRTWVWRRSRTPGPGLLARLAVFAQRRPAAVALTVTAALVALSVPAFGLDAANADASSLPGSAEESTRQRLPQAKRERVATSRALGPAGYPRIPTIELTVWIRGPYDRCQTRGRCSSFGPPNERSP
jgi:hypothetical protein